MSKEEVLEGRYGGKLGWIGKGVFEDEESGSVGVFGIEGAGDGGSGMDDLEGQTC